MATKSNNKSASGEDGPSLQDIFRMAGKRALGGGAAGAIAMGCQVTSLMWMRTIMNHQYRHGNTTLRDAVTTLYKQGGLRRFYSGYWAALAQGPLARFGDTAANVGVLQLLESLESTRDLNIGLKTVVASTAASGWRIVLMPVDALKTTMQVEGKNGVPQLMRKIKAGGPRVLWHGALAASGATFVGHYPWFATFNALNEILPRYDDGLKKLGRNAFIGFTASVVSDSVSNSIRVIKTTKQTHAEHVTYPEAVREVVAKDGVMGLFGRGLKTRILCNGLQGLMFSVLWKLIDEQFFQEKPKQ